MLPRPSSVGAAPGTIDPPSHARQPVLRATIFSADEHSEVELAGAEELRELQSETTVMWLQVEGVGDAHVLEGVGDAFDLHDLAMEDAAHLHQRPKVDGYDDHGYIVLICPELRGERDELSLEQLSIFVGERFVITIHDGPQSSLNPVADRLRRKSSRLRGGGSDYLAYAIIDAVIDSYIPVVEAMNGRIAELETEIFASPSEAVFVEIHALRHQLHTLRRILLPTREAVTQLWRGDCIELGEDTLPFLRDCRDHTAQLLDSVSACTELTKGLMDLHMARVGQRMNEAMRVLTMIATLFIPMSFIAGVYGMNFNADAGPWNMPELNWAHGYVWALSLMVATGGAIVALFWRMGWIRSFSRVRGEGLRTSVITSARSLEHDGYGKLESQ